MPRRTLTAARLILGAACASAPAVAQPAASVAPRAPAGAPGAAAPGAAPAPVEASSATGATRESDAPTAAATPGSADAPATATGPGATTQLAPQQEAAPQSDSAVSPPVAPATAAVAASAAAPPPDDDPTARRFRHTWVTWDHAVNAQTLGVGRSYQSSNPTYTMSGSFQPRYYLYDGGEVDAVLVDGRVDLIHEFTDNDATTRRGETTFGDAMLEAGYVRMLALRGEYETILSIKLPVLTFPTSKFSLANGTYLGVGSEVRLGQGIPLTGPDTPVFKRLIARASVGYNHTFSRATTPTNADLHRFRLNPEGRTVPGDQLTGVAFPEHQAWLRGRLLTDITDRLALWFEVSYQPTWKYGFGNVDVCVATGCAPAARPSDPSTFVVVTAFQTELMFELLPELGVSIGYINVATQPGPDGQRRSIFTSPGAQLYLEFVGYLDAMYATATGHRGDFGGHHLRP